MAWTDLATFVIDDRWAFQDHNKLNDNTIYINETALGNPADNSDAVNLASGKVTISHANGLTVDNNLTVNGKLKGTRNFIMNTRLGAFDSVDYYIYSGFSVATPALGVQVQLPGSIVGASYAFYSSSHTSNLTFTPRIRVNGSNVVSLAAFTVSAVDQYHSDSTSQARGIDTFVATDILQTFFDITSSGAVQGSITMAIEYILDG